jgi:hypothetical protein
MTEETAAIQDEQIAEAIEQDQIDMEQIYPTEAETKLTTVHSSLYPIQGEWTMMMDMAKMLVGSGMIPTSIDKPQKAMAIMLKGRELGIPAMQSFSHIYVVEGKPACSSELMLALMARGGVTWEWVKDGRGTDRTASIKFSRKGFPDYISTFTFADAEKIVKREGGQLLKATETYTWKQYLPNMLRARAVSNGARAFAPDLIGGMSYTIEELVDYDSIDAVEAEVKVSADDLREQNEKRKAVKNKAKREAEIKRVLKAVDAIAELSGTDKYANEFFVEKYGDLDGYGEDFDVRQTQFEGIEDLENLLAELRKLYVGVDDALKAKDGDVEFP